MKALTILAIDLEKTLKAKRKEFEHLKEFSSDHEAEVLNLQVKHETLEKMKAAIIMLEHCYALAVIAIKNADFAEAFENYLASQNLELEFGK